MIWFTWRQFRTQAFVGLAAALSIAIYLVVLGVQIRHTYNSDLARCRHQGSCSDLLATFTEKYSSPISYLGDLLIAVPGVIGIFWGAPLIARELEAGTYRLAWNQSVTRKRWLAHKISLIGLFSVGVTGLYSLLLTWATAPYDQVAADRFSPHLFDSRNITPLAYAAFALVLGATLGLLVRRVVPAMAMTLVAFAIVQVVMPSMVRPHYATPISTTVPLTAQAADSLNFFGDDGTIGGLAVPGDWVVSTGPMLDAAGRVSTNLTCLAQSDVGPCFAKEDLHVIATAQPDSRYWAFQWDESAIFLGLAALLSGLCFWRIRGSGRSNSTRSQP